LARTSTLGSPLRRSPRRPLYLQIRDRIVTAVQQGTFPLGSQLPSEPELVTMFGVGRPTVRQALALLRQEGWVTTRRGLGTFVTEPVAEVSLLGFDGLTQSLQARGLSLKDVLLETRTADALPLLGSPEGSPGSWWIAVRLRSLLRDAGTQPLCIETDCFPLELCPAAPDIFARTGSATAVLQEAYGHEVAQCEVTTRAVALPEQWADALGQEPGSPVLQMERLNRNAAGEVVHAAAFLLRTDQVPLVERLQNARAG
jgi:GntR family transcriptional regulator